MAATVQMVCPTIEDLLTSSRTDSVTHNATPRRTCRPYSKRKVDKQANIVFEYRCPVAGCLYDVNSERFFANITYLKQHYKKVHAIKDHVCGKCSKGFASSSSLAAHATICGTVYECECGMSYSTREALQTHTRRKGHRLHEKYLTKGKSLQGHPKVTSSCNNQLPAMSGMPMVVMINHFLVGSSVGSSNSSSILPDSNSVTPPRPCFILPKSAPLHSVPLPTVAAMALSELASREPRLALVRSGCTNEVGIQTEDGGRRSVGCSLAKRSSVDGSVRSTNRRATKRSAETQTARPPRKQPRRASGRCCGTQTRVRKAVVSAKPTADRSSSPVVVAASERSSIYSFEEAGTQTLALYRDMIDSMAGDTPSGVGDWSLPDMAFASGSDGPGTSSAMLELEVDINFPPVSSATQTSPRVVRLQQRQQGLLTSLRGFLTSMGEAEERLSANGELTRRNHQLSSHTQTDYELDSLLLSGGGGSDESETEEAVGGILSCTDIHTQTTEDLQDIPYEQLLSSHMETQTSEEDALFFSELSGLCDIQTQTNLCDYGVEVYASPSHHHTVADIHTQTPHGQDLLPPSTLFWRTPPPTRTNHTETQTFDSLDMCYDSALTDSHTQTPGDWSDDVLRSQLLFP